MKNKKIIIIIIALIIVFVITALGLKKVISSEIGSEYRREIVNEINLTNEIQNTDENVTEDTVKSEKEKIIEINENTKETSKENTIEIYKQEETKEIIKNTHEEIIESPEKIEREKTPQTIEKDNTSQTEKPKEEINEQPKQENTNQNVVIEKPKCTDTKHGISVGNSNKWFNSYNEAIEYYDDLIILYSDQVHNGEITSEEYYKLCPYGYETWSCPYCGKWTLNYYKR